MLDGLRAFIATYHGSGVLPTLHDMLALLRTHAPDVGAFDAFVDQWFFSMTLPEFRLSDVAIQESGAGWEVTGVLENVGTGTVEVTVGVEAEGTGSRTVRVQAAQERPTPFSITMDRRPTNVVVDPDVRVLQRNRTRARVSID